MNNRWSKLIKSLQQKKYRKKENLFIVQGEKNVLELIDSDFSIKAIFYTQEFNDKFNLKLESLNSIKEIVSSKNLKSSGTFQSIDSAIAVVNCKENKKLNPENETILALDNVRDPGNLGTIIRIADWYGISKIICSKETADLYNPKVISATMGSFTRVNLYYCSLDEYFETLDKTIEIFGSFMDGQSIHKTKYSKNCILMMGNESNGISDEIANFVTKRITIPQFGKAESLNVAIATAVICDTMKNNQI